MKIYFKNKAVERQCTNYSYAKKKYNVVVADKLFLAIGYIQGVETFEDIMKYPPFRLHPLDGDRKGKYAIDLGKKIGFRLIIEPLDEEENPLGKEKDIEIIKRCTKIVLVVEVTNHYA